MRATQQQASIDADNASFYEGLAREAFASGNIPDGCYFLDAADFYAPASPGVASERIGLLLAAMGQLTGPGSRR